MCEWIKNISPDIPLHFSRFFPNYLMKNFPPTPESALIKAAETAKKADINYVYIGNIKTEKDEKTRCPKCSKVMIDREGFMVAENKLKNGKCSSCSHKIEGVWK